MTPTTRAILGRFDGRIWAALTYCEDVAAAHPALREEYTEHANAIVDNTLTKVTKAGNFGYLSVAPNFGDNCCMEDVMSMNWETARLDRDAKAIELAKAQLGPTAMLTSEGRALAQTIKTQLKAEDEMEMLRRTR